MFPLHRIKILAVCSQNQWRSPTAEHIYRGDPRVEVRSAGTNQMATHVISQKDVDWADIIVCMEKNHKEQIEEKFGRKYTAKIRVLEIDDEYRYMDPELVLMLKREIEDILKPRVEFKRFPHEKVTQS
jgi:predicted protein tyrosine phosphatase